VYFYLLYLFPDASWVGLITFVPQLALLAVFTRRFHADIVFCVSMLTVMFVVFNKVSTVQYFVWYMCLLPAILPQSRLSRGALAAMFGTWFASMGAWLGAAGLLELRGHDAFATVWAAGLAFFAVNIVCMVRVIGAHELAPTFEGGALAKIRNLEE